jgi:hypothetical protein
MTELSAIEYWAHQQKIPPKPHWEYGGTFDLAWRGLEVVGSTKAIDPTLSAIHRNMAVHLSRAHVVTLDVEQFNALPRQVTDLTEYDPDPNLPFPWLYVSIDAEELTGILIMSSAAVGHALRPVRGEPVVEFGVIPFWDVTPEGTPFSERFAMPTVVYDVTRRMQVDLVQQLVEAGALRRWDDAGYTPHDRAVTTTSLADSLMVMRFLESANVGFAPRQVSRQVRRNAERRDRPIAEVVHVRSPRHQSIARGGEVHYSHRFEVRGHYKHYGPYTQLFRAVKRDRPHKIIVHPERGPLVRIWCPDFVKGPEDQPLVPKTRVWKARDSSD